ncbi:IPT/TIG domain-containing protein [Hymenobacter ruber]
MRYFYHLGLTAGLVALQAASALANPFTPGNIVIARVGDGSASIANSAATAVFLDEYTSAGVLVQSVALPTSVSSSGRSLTAAGNAPTELGLARTTNGRNLVLAGYGAVPGTPAVATSLATDVARVVGVVSPGGNIDTSTGLGGAFDGANVRAVASPDGVSFYVVGSDAGVQYTTLGAFSPTRIDTGPTSLRGVRIAGGDLYVSANTSPNFGLSKVGTGLPTTAGQAVTVLPGFPAATAGSSPNGFFFADLSPAVPGVDVVYVADGRTGPGNGIQKWSLVAGSWVLNGTIAGSTSTGLSGIDGNTNAAGTGVSLVASSPASLYILADNTGYNVAPTQTALPTPAARAATNTAFRGIAFAPVAPAPAIASISPGSGLEGATVTVTGSFFTEASVVKLNGAAVTTFTVVDANTITFEVPVGATSGTVAVTTPGGTATSAGTFTVLAPNPVPTITSLAPNTAVAGSTSQLLTVTGTGFVSGSVISFNNTALTTTYVSATQLTATVPASALTTAGSYGVTVMSPAPGGGMSAAVAFTVTVAAPTIVSFTPTTGGPGTPVTITGTNFTGATVVRIGSFNVPAFNVASATSITLTLPAGTGSVSGYLSVTTPGGTATSTALFNLVSATVAANALPGLSVFPNPATDRLTVALPTAAPATVTLRDLTGRLVLAPAALGADHQLLLPTSLAPGVYLLEVQQGPATAVRRIQKQ